MAVIDFADICREQRVIAGMRIPVAVAPRFRRVNRLSKILVSLMGLWRGMWLTLGYFSSPQTIVTQPYPENRTTLRLFDRYRAVLRFKRVETEDSNRHRQLLRDVSIDMFAREENVSKGIAWTKPVVYHKCTGCGHCEEACPNGSIKVIARMGVLTEDREVDRFIWRLDSCMFCNACVQACPHDAIEMAHDFENAVYDRRLLVYNLNPFAGPPADQLALEEDIARRDAMLDPRDVYGGPVPLNGTSLPNLPGVALTPQPDPPTRAAALGQVNR